MPPVRRNRSETDPIMIIVINEFVMVTLTAPVV